MSNIYVKWSRLEKRAQDIQNIEKAVDSCSSRIEKIKNNLAISDNVSAKIKAKLNVDMEALNNISRSLEKSTQALSDIARMYRDTERGLIGD